MESDGKEWVRLQEEKALQGPRQVEGFDETGKPLERITKSEQLQEQQRKMKKEEALSVLKGDVVGARWSSTSRCRRFGQAFLGDLELQEQFEMLELQNRLKECLGA